jgi:hypothetical protein
LPIGWAQTTPLRAMTSGSFRAGIPVLDFTTVPLRL